MGFVLPRVVACCMCVTLRVGCLIIGYCSALFAALSISFLSVSLYKVVEYVHSHEKTYNETLSEHTPDEFRKQSISLYIVHGYFIFVYLYYGIISVLLVVGAHKKSPCIIRWYVKAGLVLLMLAITMVIVSFVFFGFVATIPMLIWSVLLFYFVVVVRSAYLELEEDKTTQPYEMDKMYIGQAYS